MGSGVYGIGRIVLDNGTLMCLLADLFIFLITTAVGK